MQVSGGGYRATTLALGWVRALHQLGAMSKARYLSSNSGGSWFNGAYSYTQVHSRWARSYCMHRSRCDMQRSCQAQFSLQGLRLLCNWCRFEGASLAPGTHPPTYKTPPTNKQPTKTAGAHQAVSG